MIRRPRLRLHLPWIAALCVIASVTGCATLSQIAALRSVAFTLDRVDQVKVAGVRLDDKRKYSDLSVIETAQIAAAIALRKVPLDLVVHVRAENPRDNTVSARLVDLDWTLFLENTETVSGKLSGSRLLPPGEPVDIPIAAQLDLLKFFKGSGRDLVELALGIAGYGDATKEVRLEALPTIQTSMGPIRYPGRIVIRREVGGR